MVLMWLEVWLMLQMENVREMAISSFFSAKAEIDSLLRGTNPITSGFEAGISKGGPTCEHAHASFHSWHEVDDLLLK